MAGILTTGISNQLTRDEVGSEPTLQTIYKIKNDNLLLEEAQTKVTLDYLGHTFIVGHPVNGIIGTANGIDGQQIVIGSAGKTYTTVLVTNPNRIMSERFNFNTYNDTSVTTAVWSTTSHQLSFYVTDYTLFHHWVYNSATTSSETIDTCEATTGWTPSGTNSITTTSTFVKQGTYALSLIKSDTSTVVVTVDKTTPSLDFTGKRVYIWVYISTTLHAKLSTGAQALVIRFGNDNANNYKYPLSKAQLTSGWNLINFASTDCTTTGTPTTTNCDYTYFSLITENASDTAATNDFVFDDLKLISSSTTADSIGSLTGTITGAAIDTGKISNCIFLNGINSKVVHASDTLATNAWTIAGWFKFGSLPSAGTQKYVLEQYNTTNNNNNVTILVDGTNWYCYVYDQANNVNSQRKKYHSTTTLSAGTWYHLAATWDGTTLTMYENGSAIVPTKDQDSSVTQTNQARVMKLGTVYAESAGAFAAVSIDDLRMNNTALLASQIALIYNSGTGTESESIVQYNTAQSASVAYNDGTISRVVFTVQGTNTSNLTLYVSADGGSHFETVVASTETSLVYTGTDLRWKIVASGSATLSLVQITYG
jgi:hypothetical protein